MHSLSVFGTSSDAGKSTIAFALTYLLHQRGYKVAPFKAQNVSNNSRVCDLGGEIAQAQYFAAESIGLATESDMNPVLLKSGRGERATMILNGKAVGEKEVKAYYQDIDTLKPLVTDAFRRLQNRFDLVVAEGAGSPVELNLMRHDLSNITIAETFATKILLVADIERGGVFASIWGVYNLLPEQLRANVIGVVINKFRGDMSLFDEGRRIIEEEFGIKVFGVIDYRAFNLGFEDMQSLENYVQTSNSDAIRVGVIRLPHLSNFTDFEPLIADEEVHLSFITSAPSLREHDLIILPGSKLTVEDLLWVRKMGLDQALQQYKGSIVAICGGLEMLFERILDPYGIEAEAGSIHEGLGLLEGDVVFEREKVVTKGAYGLFGLKIEGYEIHHGRSTTSSIERHDLYGTFVHGIFDDDAFRSKVFKRITPTYRGYDFKRYKEQQTKAFAGHFDEAIDLDAIISSLA